MEITDAGFEFHADWHPCPDGTRYHDDSTHHYQNHELVMSFILQPLQCIAGYVL
jgi:hypothetical protein